MAGDYGGVGVIKKEDMRVVKTKNALLDSFFELLAQKTYEEITVNELCQVAGVRRATFYKHFEDKSDFLFKTVKTLREKFDRTVWKKDAPVTTKEYYVTYVRELVCYVDEHFMAAKNVLQSSIKENIVHIIAAQNYEETKKRLEVSVKRGITLPASVEATSLMLVGGVSQVLIDWIAKDRKNSAEFISSEIAALVSALIKD